MDWLIYFIAGWFGRYWWPGQEVDVPPPHDPGPWWMRQIVGIVGGGVAVWVTGATGLANAGSNPMPGIVLAIATGCVIGKFVGGLVGMMMPSKAG